MNKILITINDYQRLLALIEFASLRAKMPDIIARLYQELLNAKMVPQDKIPDCVVTMNSSVLLKELSGDRVTELTLTYPQEANSADRRISVFTPIGLELLGKQTGDRVSWKVPGGTGKFEIMEVTYQPEAVGDFNL